MGSDADFAGGGHGLSGVLLRAADDRDERPVRARLGERAAASSRAAGANAGGIDGPEHGRARRAPKAAAANAAGADRANAASAARHHAQTRNGRTAAGTRNRAAHGRDASRNGAACSATAQA